MENRFEKIENWMDQVRDDSISAEDYDFLDKLNHGGSKNNGNNGVASVGAYLAIYKEDGDLKVDEELIEEMNKRQPSGKERFSNIVYKATSSKRDGNTLYERGIDGHEVLKEWINDFRAETEQKEGNGDNVSKSNTSNQKSQSSHGGENTMTNLEARDDRLHGKIDDLEATLEEDGYEEARTHLYSIAADIGASEEELREVEENYDDLREATYAMLGVVTDRVDDLADEYEDHRGEYEELVDSLETVSATAGDASRSDEHKRHVDQDASFVDRYLEDETEEE